MYIDIYIYIYIYIAHTTDSTIPWHVGKRRYPTIARNTLFIRCMSHDQGLSSADHALNNLTKYELPSAHILRLCREVCLGLWTLTMQMWFQMFLGSCLLRFPKMTGPFSFQEAKSFWRQLNWTLGWHACKEQNSKVFLTQCLSQWYATLLYNEISYLRTT